MWTNGRAGTEDGAGCSPLSSALPAHLPWVWISRQSLHVAASAGSYPKCTALSGSAEWGGTLLSPTLTTAVPCRQYRQDNISVNLYVVNQPWLFSVLWCSGVSSVTTNACQVLKEMKHPIWLLVSDPSILHPAPVSQALVGAFLQQPCAAAWRGTSAYCCIGMRTCDPVERTGGTAGRAVPQHTTPSWCSMACLVALQPSSTYFMIWIVVDCVSFLIIIWAFVLLK